MSANDREHTQLVVREGEANVLTAGAVQQVLPGQTADVDGTDPRYANVRNGIGTDGFDSWVAEPRSPLRRGRTANYVSPQMVGAADLDQYGTWTQVPEYGAVWYPTDVGTDWAPYRNGYWTEVGAWGPTWVDYAPWGYAPFHYGRWAYIGGRWGWCPGAYVARPLWAPALVGWAGGSGWSLSATVGAPVYGWVPLAWGEPYRPWWGRCSNGCWDRYNRPYAVNVAVVRPNSAADALRQLERAGRHHGGVRIGARDRGSRCRRTSSASRAALPRARRCWPARRSCAASLAASRCARPGEARRRPRRRSIRPRARRVAHPAACGATPAAPLPSPCATIRTRPTAPATAPPAPSATRAAFAAQGAAPAYGARGAATVVSPPSGRRRCPRIRRGREQPPASCPATRGEQRVEPRPRPAHDGPSDAADAGGRAGAAVAGVRSARSGSARQQQRRSRRRCRYRSVRRHRQGRPPQMQPATRAGAGSNAGSAGTRGAHGPVVASAPAAAQVQVAPPRGASQAPRKAARRCAARPDAPAPRWATGASSRPAPAGGRRRRA